jgi:hypothetical protein
MKIRPKDIQVNLPAAHLFADETEMSYFASAINTIIHGKVKVKYEDLGRLGDQQVGLFYLQRNKESQQIRDDFVKMIDQADLQQPELEWATPQNRLCECGHDQHPGQSCSGESYNGYSCRCQKR